MKEPATGVDWRQNGLIARYSATGQLIWKKVLGGTSYDVFKRIIATTDGNYIAIGDADVPGPDATTHQDYWVVKFDPNGNVIWSKTYGGSLNDFLMCAGPLPNGGVLLAGTSTVGTRTAPPTGLTSCSCCSSDAQGAVQNSQLITDPQSTTIAGNGPHQRWQFHAVGVQE